MFIAYTKLWFALQEKLHFAIRAKKCKYTLRMKAKKGTNFISLRAKSKNSEKPNHEVTSEVSSSKIMRSKSDMTSRTATSIISPAVQ